MKTKAPRAIYILLFAYIAISLTYQIVGSVSLIVGYFDLRHQVQEPTLTIDRYSPTITVVKGVPRQLGIAPGDTLESLNGAPYQGRAHWLSVRWYAHPGETLRIGIRKPNGTRAIVPIPLVGFTNKVHPGEAIFIIFLQVVVPFVCLILGYWVAFARPTDPNAWFILNILSYPQAFLSTSTFNWWPGPLFALRLGWHLTLQILAPVALLWLGLLFPERSRIDARVPWLKWVVLSALVFLLGVELVGDYSVWYHPYAIPISRIADTIGDSIMDWITVFAILFYGAAIFSKLRIASTPDARRRLKVLCAGSAVGLGSALIIWTILPRFGLNPVTTQWLGFVSAVLLMVFPFSLAYVVVVQRAMDVSILIRTGTRYALARNSIFIAQFAVMAFLIFGVLIPQIESNKHGLRVILPIILVAFIFRLYFVKRSPSDRIREWIDRKFFREAYNSELFLSDLADRVRRITDPAILVETISSSIADVLHVPQMAVLLRNGNGFHVQRLIGVSGAASFVLPESSVPVPHLVRTSFPAVVSRERPEPWLLEARGEEQAILNDLRAEVLLPLAGRNKLMGVMVLGSKLSEEPYSPSDLRLLAAVGAQAGLGLEVNDLAHSLAAEAASHQRIQREVEIAREVQERLFPQCIPTLPGIDLAGHCRPALGVGGDYYDIIELEDGRLALAIGDVSGKGIAAALLMASLRASLRGMTDGDSHDLARMIRKLNRLVYESSAANRYATFFFAIFDPATRELHYVNAGHNPPMVIRSGGCVRLEASGPVVGLLPYVEYEQQSLQLEPGDLFIGYTDGISEAMTIEDEEWGEERLQTAAESILHCPARNILESLFRAADEFAAGAPQYDDMTLLLLRLGHSETHFQLPASGLH